MNVLLVEDSPTFQQEIKAYIEEAGHTPIVAPNGEVAVQLMESSPADLILCDVELPGLDGFETVAIIRDSLGEHWVPVIFCTNRDHIEDFMRGFNAGADDYLTKPINKRILQAKMRVMERFILMQDKLDELRNAPEAPTQFDKLTSLYSPTPFLDLAMLQWSIMSRQMLPISILVIDIDFFQAYKEYYDEDLAQQATVKVAKAISAAIKRPGDFAGVFQGDDFIVMLPDTGTSGAIKVAERVRASIERLNIEHKKSRTLGVISASVGGATCTSLREVSLKTTITVAQEELVCLHQTGGNQASIREIVQSSASSSELGKPNF